MFITAEIGSHWKGSMPLLFSIMKKCKKAGFDAIKLQSIRREDLHSRYYRLNTSVEEHNIKEIDELAREVGIEWYCMCTTPEKIDMVDPYVKRHKIRYNDSENKELIHRAISKGKQVIISMEHPNKAITSLYCIPKYPTAFKEIDFDKMKAFDGFSCHTNDVRALITAIYNGAEYIEVHVTHDTEDVSLADNVVAFDLDKCGDLIDILRCVYDCRDNSTG